MMVITNVPEREDWSGKAQNSMKMYPLGDIPQIQSGGVELSAPVIALSPSSARVVR
jgi:hypothetical protein